MVTMGQSGLRLCLIALVALAVGCDGSSSEVSVEEEVADLLIKEGRVIDPETGFDDQAIVAIREGKIVGVGEAGWVARDTLNAGGLVVAPGFIDVHGHGQDDENYAVRVRDGVTSALELEIGTADVDGFYRARESGTLINHGVSVGHAPVRMDVMDDPGTRLPAGPAASRVGSQEELEAIWAGVRRGLEEGAVAVGFSLQNTPMAGTEELEGIFALAAEFGVGVHAHIRHMGQGPEGESALDALEEVIGLGTEFGVPVHVAHVHSSGLGQTESLLDRIEVARTEGVSVTTEVYPYAAGQTSIEGSFFSEGWRERLGIDYGDLEWPATGERLTATTFREFREEGGLVIIHMIPADAVSAAIADPNTMIASDGVVQDGRGHPRVSGTYSRVLGRYVREEGTLTLSEAIRKSSLMPAQLLQRALPGMERKGRVQVGADADLVIFDPELVIDRATYEDPTSPPDGIHHVLVAGVLVVQDGDLDDSVRPGTGLRRDQ